MKIVVIKKRVADIPFAKENLVDFIVVGRPIYKSENPKLVVEEILKIFNNLFFKYVLSDVVL